MKIILSGGGTGGHIYPALAIAGEIRTRLPSAQLLFVGSKKGLEREIVPNSGVELRTLDVSGIDRSSVLRAGRSLIKLPATFFQAGQIIKDFKPDIIIGTGGYVSFPIVLAGTFFGVKTVIHEQNAIPGLANRHLARRVDYVLLTFEEASQYLRAKSIRVTGLPVRQQILAIQEHNRRKRPKENIFTLLVFGGSQGSHSINQAMLGLLDRYWQEELEIIWITGKGEYPEMVEQVENKKQRGNPKFILNILPYMFDIEKAMVRADLAICRAGASTISELQVLGLPAILIPFPFAAENHQEKNARALVNKNAAEIIIDRFLNGETLYQKVENMRKDRENLVLMGQNMLQGAKPKALENIVDIVLGLASV